MTFTHTQECCGIFFSFYFFFFFTLAGGQKGNSSFSQKGETLLGRSLSRALSSALPILPRMSASPVAPVQKTKLHPSAPFLCGSQSSIFCRGGSEVASSLSLAAHFTAVQEGGKKKKGLVNLWTGEGCLEVSITQITLFLSSVARW